MTAKGCSPTIASVTPSDPRTPDLYLTKHHRTPANIDVEYSNATGVLHITIDDLNEETQHVAIRSRSSHLGVIEPPHAFSPGREPLITCYPTELTLGKESTYELTISPFTIQDTERLTHVEIINLVTSTAERRKYLTSSPPISSQPADYVIKWHYTEPPSSFKRHTAQWRVYVIDEANVKGRAVLFRTRVNTISDKPIYMSTSPEFQIPKTSKIQFTTNESCYIYQYEHRLSGY
jgi:hypothetical protein